MWSVSYLWLKKILFKRFVSTLYIGTYKERFWTIILFPDYAVCMCDMYDWCMYICMYDWCDIKDINYGALFYHDREVYMVFILKVRTVQNFPKAFWNFRKFWFICIFLGPLVGYLGCKFGVRAVSAFGALIGAIAVGACFFAESISLVTFLYGVIFGKYKF